VTIAPSELPFPGSQDQFSRQVRRTVGTMITALCAILATAATTIVTIVT
jgi:hypothetical protein